MLSFTTTLALERSHLAKVLLRFLLSPERTAFLGLVYTLIFFSFKDKERTSPQEMLGDGETAGSV